MIINIFTIIPINTYADSTVSSAFEYLKKKMPENTYWNHNGIDYNTYIQNQDYYNLKTTKTPCNHYDGHCSSHGYTGACGCNSFMYSTQCMGFARFVCNYIFGSAPNGGGTSGNNWKSTKIDSLKPGDYIRYKINSYDYGHSVVVVKKNKNSIIVGEGNYGGPCKVLWSREISLSSLKNYYSVNALTYNGDPIFNNPTSPNDNIDAVGIYKIQTNGSGLNIRKEPSPKSEKLGAIPDLEEVIVYKISNDWGHVNYNNIKGWISMEYTSLIKKFESNSDTDKTDTDSVLDTETDSILDTELEAPNDTESESDFDTDILSDNDFPNTENPDITTDTESGSLEDSPNKPFSFDYPEDYLNDHFIKIGDISSDGFVNMIDVTLIQKIMANIISFETLSLDEKIAADIDKDKCITMHDVAMLQKIIADLPID